MRKFNCLAVRHFDGNILLCLKIHYKRKPNAACKKANNNCNILNFNHNVFTSQLDVIHTFRQSYDDFQRLCCPHTDINANTNTKANTNADSNTNTNPYANTNPNADTYANAYTNSATDEYCVYGVKRLPY